MRCPKQGVQIIRVNKLEHVRLAIAGVWSALITRSMNICSSSPDHRVRRETGATTESGAKRAASPHQPQKTRSFYPGQVTDQFIAMGYFRLDFGCAQWLTSTVLMVATTRNPGNVR
jgi:hypothetical protein